MGITFGNDKIPDVRKEYLIFEDRPPYPSKVKQRFGAFLVGGQSWEKLREGLPATVVEYQTVKAGSKEEAIAKAMDLWKKPEGSRPMLTVRDIVLKNKKLEHDHSAQFQETFGVSLHSFMDPVQGFDIIRFDDEVVKSGDKQMSGFVRQKYGAAAEDLLRALIGGKK